MAVVKNHLEVEVKAVDYRKLLVTTEIIIIIVEVVVVVVVVIFVFVHQGWVYIFRNKSLEFL